MSTRRRDASPPKYEEAFHQLRIPKCISFKSKNSADELCHCGRSLDAHSKHRPPHTHQNEWDIKIHTISEVKNEHGLLNNDAPVQPKVLEKMLLDIWKLSKPRLVMSIIGGAKYLKLAEGLETKFINEIINVALKSGKNATKVHMDT
ncbi:unnamed protein product [Didymodactylos carnosus]|uniref:Uncharacterized protein n=1 Tax=Didymodactylos carnosus TaxID=1234261 RepID=A0A815SBI7_9BILA|nr:unnamed protein product [Didymodactylos carnosus]CAF4353499.1 unnamed protein product [Didymodactylos carnosus]